MLGERKWSVGETLFSFQMKAVDTHNVVVLDCPNHCLEWRANVTLVANESIATSKKIKISLQTGRTVGHTGREKGDQFLLSRDEMSSDISSWVKVSEEGKSGLLLRLSKSIPGLSRNHFFIHLNATVVVNEMQNTSFSYNSSAPLSIFYREQRKETPSSKTMIILLSVTGVLAVFLIIIISVALFGIRKEVTLRSQRTSTRATMQTQ